LSSICNFADDNTLSAFGQTIDDVIHKLDHDIVNIVRWFRQNAMVVNPDKFQLITLNAQTFTDRNFRGFRQIRKSLSL